MGPKKNTKKKQANGSPSIIAGGSTVMGPLNQTKKNFPTLKKITDHKKTYVSPYSIKAIHKN
jgi:hypothetical protein